MIKLHLSAIDFGLEVALGGTHKPQKYFSREILLTARKSPNIRGQ